MALWVIETGVPRERIEAARGRFADMFQVALGPCRVADAQLGERPTGPIDGVVISGSPSSVPDREPWSEALAEWIRENAGRFQMLGVCYGHQLMAHALGGEVRTMPDGPELGTFRLEQLDGDWFEVGELAHEVHFDEVVTPPPSARVLARSERCPVQALAYDDWGRSVQFHPEFDAEVMRVYGGVYEVDVDVTAFDAGAVLRHWRARI
ncbi:MAG: glutamine amidotransferase [Proteobacteria bacterium]|nr:glutamine amidotransferase [Pseudomonadota bacterium]MCP4921552.1 glutamine amidotransferase [Pseudomonadota bacterium]